MRKTPFKIGKENIFEANSIKYLGVYIDKRLNYKAHIQHTYKKIAKGCGFPKYIRWKLNINLSLLYYNVCIKPVISYCILVYGCTPKTHLKPNLLL